MTKEKKLSLRLGLLAGVTGLALLASTAGSLAWYAFSRTVSLSYVGTSIVGTSGIFPELPCCCHIQMNAEHLSGTCC